MEDNISITPQGIHVMVKVCASFQCWLFSTIYANTSFENRTILWDMVALSQNFNGDWFIGGDFNEVL